MQASEHANTHTHAKTYVCVCSHIKIYLISFALSLSHTHIAEQKLPHSPGSAFTTTSEQRNLLKVQFKLVCASEMASSRQGEGATQT